MRIEAIKALPEIGKPGAVPVLVELMKDTEVAGPAQDALAGFPGKEADAAVIAMLNANTPEQKVQGIDLAARRRMKDAVPALTKAAADSDVKVRTAALRRLGELGGPSELQPLVDLLLKTTGGQELGALEQGLIAICSAIGQPDQASEKLIAAMGPAKGAQKSSLLRVLGAIGGGKALQAVRGAVADADADVHSTAIRTLGEWKSPDVADALLDIAKTSTKAADKVLSLRSYLKIADSADVKAPDKITMCKQAEALITRDEEKRSLLGVLGKAGMEALPMIAPYLDNATTKEEAAAAVVAVAEKAIRPGRPTGAPAAARLAPPLEKVVQATANDGLKKKAQALLAQLPANK
jgi:HEAT repeat protein